MPQDVPPRRGTRCQSPFSRPAQTGARHASLPGSCNYEEDIPGPTLRLVLGVAGTAGVHRIHAGSPLQSDYTEPWNQARGRRDTLHDYPRRRPCRRSTPRDPNRTPVHQRCPGLGRCGSIRRHAGRGWVFGPHRLRHTPLTHLLMGSARGRCVEGAGTRLLPRRATHVEACAHSRTRRVQSRYRGRGLRHRLGAEIFGTQSHFQTSLSAFPPGDAARQFPVVSMTPRQSRRNGHALATADRRRDVMSLRR